MPIALSLAERIAPIELLVLDVDGVLTDGSIVYGNDHLELKAFHVRDGVGLRFWKDAGKRVALISGRASAAVTRRAAELEIEPVIQGAAKKLIALREILKVANLSPMQVCAIGDDLLDVPVLRQCGLAVAVADACLEAQQEAHLVTKNPGGRGAVRELIEILMQGQGLWSSVVERLREEKL